LFDGKRVSHVLPFTRPMYNRTKLAATTQRLSISGIQTKMSLRLSGRQLEMTESGGEYILKPIPHGEFQRLDAVPINEHLTMQLARQVFGMAVAHNALIAFADGEVAYLARRFDVQPDGARSLQEDFAQVAQRSEETHGKNYKYDFSYEEMAGLIRKHVAAHRVEMEKFLQLIVFNYLIHNGDAHLKNFSLIRNDRYGDYLLTPAYDLLNTRLHLPQESRTALPLFEGDFETASFQANAFYAFDDFAELARRLGLQQERFSRLMRSFLEKENAVFSLIDRSALSEECKQLYKEHVRDSTRALAYSYVDSCKSGAQATGAPGGDPA
jgi:serine/threonine-protein kinase HipA